MPIRPFVPEDREPLRRLIEATKVFRPEEVDVALELMDEEINDPTQEEYILRTYADEGDAVRGYYCVGRTPMTAATWDLYWIVVDPTVHGRGIGAELIRDCEGVVAERGGRLVFVETSSKPSYEPTRRFYRKNSYDQAAVIKDYYADGDDLVVFTKRV
jgi:ribosomal protein S18 acetylase RimI-like enzyme